MTHVIFYEKPGCAGNARQRAALESAGHTLERRNLLTAHWTVDSLLAFLQPLLVADWFNRAAPSVKSGEVVPESLTSDQALALLLAQPLLIRRPLMVVGEQRIVGFDTARVHAWIGLDEQATRRQSLEGCASPTENCSSTT
jgi:nitrogenase-associated protein